MMRVSVREREREREREKRGKRGIDSALDSGNATVVGSDPHRFGDAKVRHTRVRGEALINSDFA